MSWKASAYVLDLARAHPWLTVTHLAVLYALGARHHQDDHCAWGQLPRIMEDTHASESTVSHALAELEDRGLITTWEGQFPRRKGDPDDRRRTRGLFFCFVGLDPEDGPAYEGVTRHVRRGGTSSHRAPNNSVANGATHFSTETIDSVAANTHSGRNSELQPTAPDELQAARAESGNRPGTGPAGSPRTGPAPPTPPQVGGERSNGEERYRRADGADEPDLPAVPADAHSEPEPALAVASFPWTVPRPPVPASEPNVPLRQACPDCGQLVGRITGKGHAFECPRFSVPAQHPWFTAPLDQVRAEVAAIEAEQSEVGVPT